MTISIGGTIGSLIFGFLVSKFAPKSTLMAFVVLSSLAIIGFVFSPTLMLALVFAILVGSLVNGCITGLYTINPTLYAPEVRSTGVGTAIGVGRIGSIVSPILAGKLLDMGIGKDDLYLGASGFILLTVVALYFLKPNER
ncbi:putative 3-hydroxyphenylpropionic transporter MhpT [Moraxella bovoculi 237]|uniref:Putative 3-hydroxyphenylpropionic transporter MhpT n=1 Tax=Moraxella bovoculi 237 TaxID=743974 RepID=A0A066UD44_9GAMM|nr:putative 3-hydroxyphenylpropionic transporter MhpT [Moraxella bovoculi 237]